MHCENYCTITTEIIVVSAYSLLLSLSGYTPHYCGTQTQPDSTLGSLPLWFLPLAPLRRRRTNRLINSKTLDYTTLCWCGHIVCIFSRFCVCVCVSLFVCSDMLKPHGLHHAIAIFLSFTLLLLLQLLLILECWSHTLATIYYTLLYLTFELPMLLLFIIIFALAKSDIYKLRLLFIYLLNSSTFFRIWAFFCFMSCMGYF